MTVKHTPLFPNTYGKSSEFSGKFHKQIYEIRLISRWQARERNRERERHFAIQFSISYPTTQSHMLRANRQEMESSTLKTTFDTSLSLTLLISMALFFVRFELDF